MAPVKKKTAAKDPEFLVVDMSGTFAGENDVLYSDVVANGKTEAAAITLAAERIQDVLERAFPPAVDEFDLVLVKVVRPLTVHEHKVTVS